LDLFDAVEKRRSIRKFTEEPLPDEVIRRALQAAILAPNSGNMQTWDFHWIKGAEIKKRMVAACFNQSGARTASQLLVLVANPKHWRRSNPRLIDWVKQANAPKSVLKYYEKAVPIAYTWGWLNSLAPIKWLAAVLIGMFRPMQRSPIGRRDAQEVSIKSAALAAENFVLAITAQGGASCMMEGFDEARVKRMLELPGAARVVMIIAAGYESPRGTWGPRFRMPLDEVLRIWN